MLSASQRAFTRAAQFTFEVAHQPRKGVRWYAPSTTCAAFPWAQRSHPVPHTQPRSSHPAAGWFVTKRNRHHLRLVPPGLPDRHIGAASHLPSACLGSVFTPASLSVLTSTHTATPHPTRPSMAVMHPGPHHPYRQHLANMAVPSKPDRSGGERGPPSSPTPDRLPRSSFSSIREQDSDLAQSFTASRVSSLLIPEDVLEGTHHDGVRGRDSAAGSMTGVVPHGPLTQPHSRLHRMWYPSDHFMGWKEIAVRGKVASRSFSDFQALCTVWTTSPTLGRQEDENEPGCSTLELLPDEVLGEWLATC